MAPTLIVLALIALGVGIVVWATRRRPGTPTEQRSDQDTAWNDPVASNPDTSSPFPPIAPPEQRP